jgi:hypothetical protein
MQKLSSVPSELLRSNLKDIILWFLKLGNSFGRVLKSLILTLSPTDFCIFPLPNDAKEIHIRLIMKSEVLIAHVPPRIATLVKARARDRQLSTSRFITKLIEKEVDEEEDETITYTYDDLLREVREAKADVKAGRMKSYSDVEELIRDLHEHAGIS